MENRYCLQMVSCGDGCCGTGNGGTPAENVYSTEETVCGKWIDGKPIYRKVITGTLANESGNGFVFANVSDLKIDRVINLYGNMIQNNGEVQVMLQTSFGSFGAVSMYYGIKTGNISYYFLNNNGQYSGCTAYVVIEYIKK
ncbi:MAG TPA: hypothetical protein DEQ64_21495 [Lachnoclostridium sp.]|uniref:hypothetical protein n=1 Tax=Lacrimispora sp. TaxID=2719234 RepID=UPI000EBB4C05|nr:hypothetical protein [Lacrimispora sp.]HCD46245.1 hypothetical protein [Lachnoclostridium sp.]